MAEGIEHRLLSPEEAATLVGVDREEVYHWMADDKVPHVELTGQRGEYRLPMQGLLASMPNLFDLAEDLKALDDAIEALPEEARQRLQEGLQ